MCLVSFIRWLGLLALGCFWWLFVCGLPVIGWCCCGCFGCFVWFCLGDLMLVYCGGGLMVLGFSIRVC